MRKALEDIETDALRCSEVVRSLLRLAEPSSSFAQAETTATTEPPATTAQDEETE